MILAVLARFRRGADGASGSCLCGACTIAIRGVIGSPLRSPTSISHSIAASQSGISNSASGNLMVCWAASRGVTRGFRPGNMIGSKNCRCHDPAARRSIRECLYPNSRAWASTDLVEAFSVQTTFSRTINILYCIAFRREYWCRRLQADFCRKEIPPRLTSLAMERALAVGGAFLQLDS